MPNHCLAINHSNASRGEKRLFEIPCLSVSGLSQSIRDLFLHLFRKSIFLLLFNSLKNYIRGEGETIYKNVVQQRWITVDYIGLPGLPLYEEILLITWDYSGFHGITLDYICDGLLWINETHGKFSNKKDFFLTKLLNF